MSSVGSPVAYATHTSTLRIAVVRTGILLSLELLALAFKVPGLAAIEANPLFCTRRIRISDERTSCLILVVWQRPLAALQPCLSLPQLGYNVLEVRGVADLQGC
jgi:hypothetical protein